MHVKHYRKITIQEAFNGWHVEVVDPAGPDPSKSVQDMFSAIFAAHGMEDVPEWDPEARAKADAQTQDLFKTLAEKFGELQQSREPQQRAFVFHDAESVCELLEEVMAPRSVAGFKATQLAEDAPGLTD